MSWVLFFQIIVLIVLVYAVLHALMGRYHECVYGYKPPREP